MSDFALEVPRNFKVPNTQQWNLTVQRDLGKQWVLEVGYVGTHAIHLRETRDAIQSLNATPTTRFFVNDVNGNSYSITSNTLSNAVARTPTPGLNGYAGYQFLPTMPIRITTVLQATFPAAGKTAISRPLTHTFEVDRRHFDGNTAFNTAYNDQSNINASRGLVRF